MGMVTGLTFGLSVFLILYGINHPPQSINSGFVARTIRRRQMYFKQARLGKISYGQFTGIRCLLGVIFGLITFGISRNITAAILVLCVAFFLPRQIVARRRNNRRKALMTAWPEALDAIISGIRAGLSLPESLLSLPVYGPAALRDSFTVFSVNYRATGQFTHALKQLKDECADSVADRVCETLVLAQEVGGQDVGRVLSTLSEFIRQDQQTRGELAARQSWVTNGARVAVIAPWLVLLLLSSNTNTYLLYQSVSGQFIIAIGALVCAGAYAVMLRIGLLPEEKRVLA